MGCIQQLLVLLKQLQNCKPNTVLFTQTQHAIGKIISINDVSEIISILEEHSTKNNTPILAKLVIDNQNNITVPHYAITLKFAHLTKAIYILFLKHPNGILLKELSNYKKELLAIYKEISYQNSYIKMQQTIDKLIASKNNEIYRHLSRIKQEVYSKLPKEIADTYCVLGGKNEVKKIMLSKNSKNIRGLQCCKP